MYFHTKFASLYIIIHSFIKEIVHINKILKGFKEKINLFTIFLFCYEQLILFEEV